MLFCILKSFSAHVGSILCVLNVKRYLMADAILKGKDLPTVNLTTVKLDITFVIAV